MIKVQKVVWDRATTETAYVDRSEIACVDPIEPSDLARLGLNGPHCRVHLKGRIALVVAGTADDVISA